MTPCALRALGTSQKTQNILFRNVYDWFERLERGVYALRPRGRDEIAADYASLAAHYCRRLDEESVYHATEMGG